VLSHLHYLQADHERFKLEAQARYGAVEKEVNELKVVLDGKDQEVGAAKQAEQEFAAECERLDHDFRAEKQKLVVSGLDCCVCCCCINILCCSNASLFYCRRPVQCGKPMPCMCVQAELEAARHGAHTAQMQTARLREEVDALYRQVSDGE
jgi:hypothetical protein